MKNIYLSLLVVITSISTQAQTPELEFVEWQSGFDDPIAIVNAGDDRLFIVEQKGVIKVVDDGNISTFMNIQNIVNDGDSEQGLLGLAFHPNYATNGYFYINYTNNTSTGSTGNQTSISRFSVSPTDANEGDASSEEVVILIDQPYWNHNGGSVNFGPDGYLYIGMGDGGSGGDPDGNGQNMLSHLGKILRLDVDNGSPYSIPASNPFVGANGYAEEIWASGVRNPWKFSFDKTTGDLWIGDVGQNAWEEIDFQSASSDGGLNFGWNCYEGDAPYSSAGCNDTYTFPIHTYVNDGFGGTSGCSVTGGYVYRGSSYPNFVGHYVFGDYCSGKIYTIYDDGGGMSWETTTQENTSFYISTFGEDASGELYLADLGSGTIYHIEDNSDATETSWECNYEFSNGCVELADASGTYSTLADCEAVCDPIAISENTLQTGNIYPNPTSTDGIITFSIPEGEYLLNITDVTGKMIAETTLTNNTYSLNGILAKGVYFLQVGDYNGKLIVQ